MKAYEDWPQGDAGDAIDFACDHVKDKPMLFLEDWRVGRADQWPEYMKWLATQHAGAKAAKARRAQPQVKP